MWSTIIVLVGWAVLVTFVAFVAYRSGHRDGRKMWVAQCHALITVIEINQKATHTPMVNGDRVIEALRKFVGDREDKTVFVPPMDSPFDSDVIRPGDPGWDLLERARRDGFAEGEL